MNIAVVGSHDWTNYSTVMRTLTVAVEDWKHHYPDDRVINFVHTGYRGAESMVVEYVGKVEGLLKQKGYKINEYRIKSKDLIDLVNSDITWSIVFKKNPCKRCDLFVKLSTEKLIPTQVEEE